MVGLDRGAYVRPSTSPLVWSLKVRMAHLTCVGIVVLGIRVLLDEALLLFLFKPNRTLPGLGQIPESP